MALIDCHFYSQVLGLSSTMSVILPNPVFLGNDEQQASQNRKYPTLFLLHGLSDDHTIWQRRTAIERYVEPLDLAIVMPAVQRSYYTNTITGAHYWTFISEELPFVARSFFPLSEAREENFVAGLSMGGYGAFKLALSCPDRFAAAASLSGVLDIVQRVHDEEKAGGGELQYVFGNTTRLTGGSNDLFHLARQLTREENSRPNLYQWCGTEDPRYQDNLRFLAHAESLGLAITFEEGPGGHEWACWDQQIQRVLAWLPGIRGL